MQKVNVGLIGAGHIAQVTHLPILARLAEVNLVAVCEAEKQKARAIALKHSIPHAVSSIEEFVKIDEMEAVIVATPTDHHKVAAIAALEAGKDVFVEKPIARTLKEAKEIVAAAKANNRKLMVGMNNRFRPDVMILKNFLENKELGKIFYVKSGWLKQKSSDRAWLVQEGRSGGGVFIDLGIAMLDMTLWLLGYPKVESVTATNYSHTTKTVEDTSIVYLKLSGGITLTIEVSWALARDGDFFYCNVFGDKGSAFINPLKILKPMHGSLINLAPAKMEAPANMYRRSYESELKHFFAAVRELAPVISTGEEAVARMAVVEAVYQSAKRGKEIRLK